MSYSQNRFPTVDATTPHDSTAASGLLSITTNMNHTPTTSSPTTPTTMGIRPPMFPRVPSNIDDAGLPPRARPKLGARAPSHPSGSPSASFVASTPMTRAIDTRRHASLSGVETTPLSHIPGACIQHYLGRVRVQLIKEVARNRGHAHMDRQLRCAPYTCHDARSMHPLTCACNELISHAVCVCQVWGLTESGGLGTFAHRFLAEVCADTSTALCVRRHA